jgi:glyoxylase-like metal-dependent hydrolase (beta-lactamase superfamily II)
MKITDNVYMLDTTAASRAYLVLGEENILIDTGMPGAAKQIRREIEGLGIDIKSIRKILLTHHDVDHLGNAKALLGASKAGLWAPAPDVPYITGEKKRPGVKRVVSVLMRAPKPPVTGTYDRRQNFGGIRAISAPGHTPGHTIFQYHGVVFAGDLLQTRGGKISLLPPFMNWDMNDVKKSVALLKTLEFEWLCPAHGAPVKHDAALDEFLRQFSYS